MADHAVEKTTSSSEEGGATAPAQTAKGHNYPSAPVALWSAKAEKKLRRKIDAQIVTISFLLYLLSFLDRSNIGQARLNGIEKDLHLKSFKDYQIALTVLYVPYIAFEVFSNLFLKRVGPANWISGLVTVWGIVATLQGIVTSRTGLYINRFFLGLTEAGILPGLAVYLTFFYKPSEIQLRQALYFSGASLAGAFNGLLAVAINKLDGRAGLAGWSWLFILEGIFTVVCGVIAFFVMPNSPTDLWGVTAEEKRIAVERLSRPDENAAVSAFFVPRQTEAKSSQDEETASDSDGAQAAKATNRGRDDEEIELGPNGLPLEKFDVHQIIRALTDPFVLLLVATGFCSASGVYALAFFLPTVINGLQLGLSTTEAQLLSAPPFAAAFLVSVALAFLSDRLRWRWLSGAIAFTLAIIGYAMALGTSNARVQYGAIIILTSGCFSSPPTIIAWMVTNTAGYYKRATGIALMIMGTNCGGIAASWMFTPSEAPRFKRGFSALLGLNCAGLALVTIIDLYLLWNRKQRRGPKTTAWIQSLRDQGWSEARIRLHLGDRHPDYPRDL